jgi:molybdopterin biosynthesis enzyme
MERLRLPEARAWLATHMRRRGGERVAPDRAVGRVLAADVALATWPPCPTAAVGGFAIRAADSEGAAAYAPMPVRATAVAAGAAMPAGTDAVIVADELACGAVLGPVARGAGVHPAGHDSPSGAILPSGLRLRPLHVALLRDDALVHPQARVAAEDTWLRAMIAVAGGAAAGTAGGLAEAGAADLVLLPDDRGGVPLLEAIAVGLVDGAPGIGLPAHPADAATLFALLVAPALRGFAGLPEAEPGQARLGRKVTSALGQMDAVRVRLVAGEAIPLGPAEGIGVLAAAAADGLVLVPEGSEGYPAGALVPIYPA